LSQRLNSFFTSTLELRLLSGKVQQLRALELHYAKIVPPSLLRASQVIRMEKQILTLAANNSAIAAKLRQMTPELVKQLQLLGCEVTGIQVRVQVTLPPDSRIAGPVTLSPQGFSQLTNLALSLSDSPLKNALQRLLGRKKNKPD